MNTSLPSTPRKRLPIGIQTLAKIREGDCYYVDKTGIAVDLVANGSHYFLSRPRRFGKSLFLDTLKELFEGNRSLFTGLIADTHWDWSKKYPVIRISFGGGVLGSSEKLQDSIDGQLLHYEQMHGLQQQNLSVNRRFANLIAQAHARTGQRVVVLVDEYDKPILDCIEDPTRAIPVREALKNIYSVIKDSDAHIKFAFLTGVSKFSKVSLFSDLNNLTDITLDKKCATICGYTDADIDTVFAPELPGLDRAEIRHWYNGYRWLGEGVYNPFDVLLLFRNRTFRPYWFETGTPTFLVKLLSERGYFTPDLAHRQTSLELLSAFDVEAITSEALLWQTGYLTVTDVHELLPGIWVYTLGYPNHEVKTSLNTVLLAGMGLDAQRTFTQRLLLPSLLRRADLAGLHTHCQSLFASIPHQWQTNNPIAQYEGYYASIFYSHFAALGLDIRLEDSTSQGRIDMAVLFEGQVFLFEFKVVEFSPEGRALQQLKDKRYADKYRSRGEPVHLIGIEFSKAKRNVVGFEVETL